MTNWTQPEAISICMAIEAICPKFGCHVALTGGLLYKDGPRKDCDILFYRIRQVKEIRAEAMFEALRALEIIVVSGFGWCVKCTWNGKPMDCFFPEELEGGYDPEPEKTI